MAIERRTPLPPGRYWLDVSTTERIDDFERYLVETAREAIVVESREDSEAPTSDVRRVRKQRWFLFRVLRPVRWFPGNFGSPTIAPASVKTRADTAQNEPTPYWWSEYNFDGNSVRALLWLGVLYALAGEGKQR